MNYDTILNPYYPTKERFGACTGLPVAPLVVTGPTGSSRSITSDSFTSYKSPPSGGSWKEIRESGVIRMTDYKVGKNSSKYQLAQVTWLTGAAKGACHGNNCPPGGVWTLDQLVGHYTEQGDFSYWREKYPLVPYYSLSYGDYSALLETAKTSLVAESVSNYDFLTEAAEAKETLGTIRNLISAAYNPLRSYKDLVDKVRSSKTPASESVKILSDAWLQLQYGIMPLFYSIKDLKSLYEKRDAMYQTTRRRFDIPIEPATPDLSETCFFEEGSISGSVSLTGKSRYSGGDVSHLLDSISINPFLTGWELIPYSFVVDWFVNVGDWIVSQSSPFSDIAVQRAFCYAVKLNGSVNVKLHLKEDNSLLYTWDLSNCSTCYNCPQTGEVLVYSDDKDMDLQLIEKEWSTYERTIFSATDTELSFSPYLDWKRWITGFSLSVRPLLEALRSL